MRNLFSSIKLMALFAVSLGTIHFLGSCNPDDGETGELTASFQYEISESNFLEVSFMNFSKGAATSAWDFGDGNSSTEESPSHTYAEAGTYEVKLTITGADGETTSEKTEKINVVDPNDVIKILTGDVSKKWILLREGIALGIGEAPGNTGWWNFGESTPLGDRPCILDDEYTFFADGTFGFESNNTFFLDSEQFGGWNDDLGEGCHEENEAGVWTGSDGIDRSAFANGGDYTFALDGEELTIDGLGAYIGIPVKTAAGDNSMPIETKTYQVLSLYDGDGVDSLTIALVSADNSAWTFYLVHYENEADMPDIPSAKPKAGFTFQKDGNEVTFTNTSVNSTDYTWDFGDGNSSMDENPVHTYGAEGTYTVTLTASDGTSTDETSQEVVISAAEFSASVLSSASGKTWKLAPIAGAMKVGDAIGSGGWWQTSEGDITTRDCHFDDEFIFTDGGNFEYASQGSIWGETWMGVAAEGCTDESALASPYDAFTSNDGHSFEVDVTGEKPTIKVSGTGAFLGLQKAYNGGELKAGDSPVSEITYTVQDYAVTDTEETLVIYVDISEGEAGTGFWTFTLTHQK
jgi:PKD repeat protein